MLSTLPRGNLFLKFFLSDQILCAFRALGTDLIPGASITEEFREKLLSLINFDFKDYLLKTNDIAEDAQKLFEYKGMEKRVILQKYVQKAGVDPEAIKNLITMIVLLCERGTNFDKFKRKMSSEDTKLVNELKNKYGLVSKLSPDKSNELTLARIGHCFPLLVCSYMQQCKAPNVSDLTMAKWAKGYPRVMKTSAFTALIPKNPLAGFPEHHGSTLTIAYLCHQIGFSKIGTKRRTTNQR